MRRRQFLHSSAILGTGILALGTASCGIIKRNGIRKITILHTNDTHSRIDPFPTNDRKFAGLGGFAKRASLVKKIREEEENVLLFDSGDIFQGTPYFNYYEGELEMKLMSEIGYDAATIGNHDFDNGISGLAKQMDNASFPFICSNYNLANTELEGKVAPHKIFEIDGIRIGVFGLGIELDGLVNPKLYGRVGFLDPLSVCNNTSRLLKHDLKSNVVVCLSHLGYEYADNRISDLILAEQSENVDFFLGGHTHTFLDQPVVVMNNIGQKALICQVGWAGIKLGKLDLIFTDDGSMLDVSYVAPKVS